MQAALAHLPVPLHREVCSVILPGKDLSDSFRRTLPSMIRVKLKLVMLRFLANPPWIRGAKHS